MTRAFLTQGLLYLEGYPREGFDKSEHLFLQLLDRVTLSQPRTQSSVGITLGTRFTLQMCGSKPEADIKITYI